MSDSCTSFGRLTSMPRNRNARVVSRESDQKARMCPAATAGANDRIDVDSQVKTLSEHFFCAGYITERSDLIRSISGNDVRMASRGSDFIRDLLHLGHHVRFTRDDRNTIHTEQIEEEIVPASLYLVTVRDAFFQNQVTLQSLLHGSSGG
jgi:hypothetical protein